MFSVRLKFWGGRKVAVKIGVSGWEGVTGSHRLMCEGVLCLCTGFERFCRL